MSRLAVDQSAVRVVVLDREDRVCPQCGGRMHVRCSRQRCIHSLDGPLQLDLKLVQCSNAQCAQMKLFSPEQECGYAMPRWGIGWDVFCWIGQRRFSRHWSVPQIRHELYDSYQIRLSDDAIEDHIASYQNMVAARHQAPQELAKLYGGHKEIALSIDGLQPEKGHETIYVVREVTQRRVWFAEALLSGATDEIRKLFIRAKELAVSLNLKVVLWITDKQEAFVSCAAAEFPDVPHRYCENHFFRDLAKPVLEADSTAKKKMRSKIRGLRAVERVVLDAQQATQAVANSAGIPAVDAAQPDSLAGEAGEVVLDYCSMVRGILNDNHGGPYNPPGLRMLDALGDVRESLARIASSARTGPEFALLNRLQGFIDRGVAGQQEAFTRVRSYTDQVREVMDILNTEEGTPLAEREPLFAAKLAEFQQTPSDPILSHLAKVMTSFRVGLFAGAQLTSHPRDNLHLERWFRLPKSHERRVHGHHHAGVRIVREGATLIPTLDAHANHPGLFTREELSPFQSAITPSSQIASQQRHRIMAKSRSKKSE